MALKKEKAVKDERWYALKEELKAQMEDSGQFTRVVVGLGLDRTRLEIRAEIWDTAAKGKQRRTHTYSCEWPHGNALDLTTACWQALCQVWRQYDAAQSPAKSDDT